MFSKKSIVCVRKYYVILANTQYFFEKNFSHKFFLLACQPLWGYFMLDTFL